MANEETLTIPAVGDIGTETPAPETSQAAQAAPESQSTTTSEVDAGSKEPQVPEAPRRKPSDFYRERQTIRELKETVAELRKKQEELDSARNKTQAVAPEPVDFDPAHFSPEHKRILLAREKFLRDKYDAEITALKQEVSGWKESQVMEQADRKNQEALEKLFPKSSPDSKETLAERVARDPERAERIRDLLINSGLNELSKTDPERAVKYALMELGEATGKPANPTVLKKNMMGGNTSGNPGMGQKRSVSEQDLRAENKKLSDQLGENPALRSDEKFMERRRQVMSELEKLVQEKRG